MNEDLALRRLIDALISAQDTRITQAANSLATQITESVQAAIDAHAAQRQFVHGSSDRYLATTTNPGQFVRWSEITEKPDYLNGDAGATATSFPMESIRIDASQVVSGVFPAYRIPLAAHNEDSYGKAVRASDPRLQARTISFPTSEPLATGDFVSPDSRYREGVIRRADARRYQDGYAIGFVAEPYGEGDFAEVFPSGSVDVSLMPEIVSGAVIGQTLFLSDSPGRSTAAFPLTVPSWIQPVGVVMRVLTGNLVQVMVRPVLRVWNESIW